MTKTFTRRAIVQRAWQAAAALALSRGTALAAATAPVFLNDPFQLGVASGDPVADGFVIWTRLAPDPFDPQALPFEPIEVTWEVAADEGMKKIVARGNQMARPHMSHSVHVDVRGLEPARPYFYRFHCGPAASRIGRAMTLPTPRLPVDRLNGDIADTVRLYRPNNTNTNRIGLTSSLIWKFADRQSIRLAYTFDRAKHRQTGEIGFIKTDGSFEPENVFAGKSAGIGGRQIPLPDGTILRRRDRASVALLNQVAVEYRGRFMGERLLLNAGLRAPYFTRHLNQFCYQRDTFNAYCTTQVGTPVPGTNDGTGKPLVTFPVSTLNTSAAFRYGQPRSFNRKYDKLLPNFGTSYDFSDDLTVFVSYAQTLSSPRICTTRS